MLLKRLSLLVALNIAALSLLGFLQPNDLLFNFFSNQWLAVFFKLGLVAWLFHLAQRAQFFSSVESLLARSLGLALVVFSLVGTLSTPLEASLFNFIRPFDYIVFLEVGVLLLLASVTLNTRLTAVNTTAERLWPAVSKVSMANIRAKQVGQLLVGRRRLHPAD